MYDSYFGFRHPPFGVTPDPRFLYRNTRYEEAFATLLYAIRQRKGFVLLTGEVGTGKTTLLHALIAELGATPFVFVFNPVADFDQLLTIVCDELGLTPERAERPARLAVLNEFLTAQLRAGRTTVLLLDEAQNLSPQTLEDLRQLSNLETPTEKLLQIVMVGQPELAARLADPSLRQLRQRIPLRQELRALSSREVGDFVRFRLRAAGSIDESVFAPSAIARIARLSGGIPRLVNVICDNSLLVCYGLSQRSVTTAMVDEVAADLRLDEAPAAAARPLDQALREVEIAAEVRRSQARSPKLSLATSGVITLVLFSGLAAALTGGDVASRLVGWPAGATRPAQSASEAAPIATSAGASDPPLAPAPRTASAPGSFSGPAPRAFATIDVPYGTTLLEMLDDAYGPYCWLALGVVTDANPGVRNFDRMLSGRPLTLPTLDRDALLQPDAAGAQSLLIGARLDPSHADRLARAFRRRSRFETAITERALSPRLSLYQVFVTGLADTEDVSRAWKQARAMNFVPERLEAFGNGPIRRRVCSDRSEPRAAARGSSFLPSNEGSPWPTN